MANWGQWLTLLFLALSLSGGPCATAQNSDSKPPGKDTTVILRQLSRWDNDSTFNTQAQTFNDIWGWEGPDGREYAIMGGLAFTYFIDITDPYEPRLVAKKPGRGDQGIHRDYATYQHYCYAVSDEKPAALRIYDLSHLPDSVPLVYDSQEHGARVHNVFREGKRLYLADNNFRDGYSPLSVLSLADPENPTLLNHLEPFTLNPPLTLEEVHDVYVNNDTVYASKATEGFFIFDYTDPEDPELISQLRQYPFQGYNHSSWVTADGKTLVMADENHGLPLKVFDVSNPGNLVFQSTMGVKTDQRSIPHNPLIKGDLAYVSYYHMGLQVFDISNPKAPERVFSAETFPQYEGSTFQGFFGCWGVYPFFSSGVIAASDMTNGLYLYRIDTVISKPSETFKLFTSTRFRNQIDLRLDLYEKQALQLTLFNIQGQRLRTAKTPVWPEGEQRFSWHSLGGLKAGMYWLKARGDGDTQVKQMLKVR